jgi:uncharacterized protein (TIGR00106 family)
MLADFPADLWTTTSKDSVIVPRSSGMQGGSDLIAQFKVLPVGKGESLSEYVAECVRMVEESGLKHQLTPMSTIVEGDLDEVMEVILRCHKKMREMSNRVVTSIEIDDRGGSENAMTYKVRSVEGKLRSK